MKKHTKQLQKGFTLVETLVAILILTMTVGALLSLAAGGFFSVRYARNQIVGDNLLQESLEYLRNNRDTSFAQGMTWTDWLATLNVDENGQGVGYGSNTGCFSDEGCIVDPYTKDAKIRACQDPCDTILFYPNVGFYGYESSYPDPVGGEDAIETSFVRTITAVESENDPDQIIVTAKIQWLNGTNPKTVSQSMVLTNWVP
jgi:type II secretory pathway pseudopilin PulG